MKPFLKKLFKYGQMRTAGNKLVKIHSSIEMGQAVFLQKMVRKIKPRVSLEVGLAFGLSAITVMDAMKKRKGSKFICMDPSQYDSHKDIRNLFHGDMYNGLGLLNIKRAGHLKMVEFYNNTSQQVLPLLVSKGITVDFAFIDGWHTFDHTLVDFFYIDQLLKPGGVVVFHDVYYPAIYSLCNFIYLNRKYEIFDHFPKSKYPFNKNTSVMAFKKIGTDDRSWNNFVEFWNFSIAKSIKQRIFSLLRLYRFR